MGNPVGSYETYKWHKDMIPVKAAMDISPTQKSVISGSLLGDVTMRIGRNAKNANFNTEQGLEQKDYVLWKYDFLKSLVLTEPRLSYRYRESGKKYPKSWWFRTVRHPLLTEIYHDWYTGDGYRTGTKIVPKSVVRDLTPLALAIWVMDDGSYSRKSIDISTYSFTRDDIEFLQYVLRTKHAVDSKYHRDRDKGYRMTFPVSETHKLISIIHQYIVPSMMYKVGS